MILIPRPKLTGSSEGCVALLRSSEQDERFLEVRHLVFVLEDDIGDMGVFFDDERDRAATQAWLGRR